MNIKKILPVVFKQGSQIIAATTTPLLQTLISDPTGIIPNSIGVVMTTFGETIADTLDRNMSQQEVIRTNKAYIYFVEKLERNLSQGLKIRNDDFFRSPVGYRKPAEELFEGMLVKARNQYEEAKVEFFSNLYANGCVDHDLSPQMISLFILILDRLSFNHLDLLNRFDVLGGESLWKANHAYILQKENPLLPTCIEELKSLNLINPTFWGDSPLVITDLGKRFIKSIEFKAIFEFTHNDCISINNPARW